ncbi:GEVED domain-containing protein [Hymenobacter monticola]|uniref:GEVED domain-containing protein n=2 Tax=Hymenobacter monticola TaxID=1705399 RepID=A0ABY4BBA4_9BACT|nr:GEVED domain-containing protein [Hymenobacter monticola]
MIITTGGTNAHDIRVYLDANNDGTLTSAEQIYQSLNTLSPGATTNITLPGTVTLNRPLRLRVVADAVGNSTSPCSNQVSGQAEDYTIIARPNTSPPTNVGFFTSNYVAGGCVNPVQFIDASQNAPTSWLWNFGDGTTSTLQNPTHQYTTAGTFTVSLTATNANGAATGTRLNYITIQIPCFTYCAANGTGGAGPNGTVLGSPFYITSVAVANAQPGYNNTTGNSTGGYGNFTSNPITMGAGRTVNLSVGVNLTTAHRVAVWVDQNQNGVFDNNELLSSAVPSTLNYTTTFTVNSPAAGSNMRMRVMTVANANTPFACTVNLLNAEYEDYQLLFGPLASRQEQALPSLSLYPTPTPDGRVHLRLPDASAAGTYTAAVQNLLGATLLSTTLRLGPDADAELDLSRLAPGVYLLQLRDAQGQTAVRRVVRE